MVLETDFEWDDNKSHTNVRLRGFDFKYASRIFEGLFVEGEGHQGGYGESRTVAVGKVGSDFVTVVYCWREGRRRIISARPSNRKERDGYNKKIAQ